MSMAAKKAGAAGEELSLDCVGVLLLFTVEELYCELDGDCTDGNELIIKFIRKSTGDTQLPVDERLVSKFEE